MNQLQSEYRKKPPIASTGTLGWLKTNLFFNWTNTFITLFVIFCLYKFIPWILDWAIFSADFRYNYLNELITNQEMCTKNLDPEKGGACWAVIFVRFYQFIYGFYPKEQVWRVNTSYILLILILIPILFNNIPYRKYFLRITFLFPFIIFFLLNGGFGLSDVSTNKWGGLLVTLVLGCTGIALAFPIGILLALGRRSNLPVISTICVLFIEFIRGVPLITLLFFGMVMLPLFLPNQISLDGLIRVLVAVTLFQSAYMAEVIRGGLQAIPQGQYEAARSIGLSYWQMNLQIILPQAIRISIPSIVNTSIGLFKDTTLVIIVGILDLLGIGRGTLADTNWLGLSYEIYFFISLVFFIFTFGMSRYSLYLEKKLKTGINMEAD